MSIQTTHENRSTDAPVTGNRPSNAITTNCCDAWWTGLNSAHCTACHHTFTGPSGFDAHRRGGHCIYPVKIGMVRANKPWSGWSHPGTWRGPEQ